MKKPSVAIIIDFLILVLFLFFSILSHCLWGMEIKIKGLTGIVNGLLLYLSITIGFFGTSISVLISIMEKDFMKNFFESQGVKYDFIKITYKVVISGALSILLSLLLIILNSNNFDFIYNVYILFFYIGLIVFYSLNLFYMTLTLLDGLSDMIKDL